MDTNHETSLAGWDDDALQDDTDAHVARVQHVYREIERRDGSAQWHARAWRRFAVFLGMVLAGSVGANVYLAVKASRVQAFVQPVQVTDEGKMVLVGIPLDVLAYEPDEAAWMDMLTLWTTHFRWRSADTVLNRNLWAWLYNHTCGEASKFLAKDEIEMQPFKPSKARTSIDIKSITKTDTPKSYQVLWRERLIDGGGGTMTEYDYTGTFTVARTRPKTLDEAKDNRLGLCVNGYSLAKKKVEAARTS